MQIPAFLHHCPSFYHKRAMIYQRFGQGVSNLSSVAELRTFDGRDLAEAFNKYYFSNLIDFTLAAGKYTSSTQQKTI